MGMGFRWNASGCSPFIIPPMTEYLIRRTDGEWFDLHATRFGEALRPISFASERVPGFGNWRIRIEGVEISFSYEDPGMQITIEGELPPAIADQIAEEIRQNIELVTGQKARVVAL
jgi:hypothetical protein